MTTNAVPASTIRPGDVILIDPLGVATADVADVTASQYLPQVTLTLVQDGLILHAIADNDRPIHRVAVQ